MTDVNVELDLRRYQDVMTIQRVLHTAKTIAIVFEVWSRRWIATGSW